MEHEAHWESIYGRRLPSKQGWYTPCPQPSFPWVQSLGLDPNDLILDIGGGASTLVDHVLKSGHEKFAVLDLSNTALNQAQARLGPAALSVQWLQGDMLNHAFENGSVTVWHDRAAFHFLLKDSERASYRQRAKQAVRTGGWLILGSFRSGAPDKCSGLPVRHHSADELTEFFSAGFDFVKKQESVHITPGGVEQAYVFVCLQRQRNGSEM